MEKTLLTINNLPKVRGEYRFAEPLNKYTWLNVGGPADVIYFPQDEADLQHFMQNINKDIPVFILGGGSNLLVRDGGISGVVIKLQNANFATVEVDKNLLRCGAGLLNHKLKNTLIKHGIHGLEFLCTIPGSIGGALRSNAGCFGSDISQVLLCAKVMNGDGEIFVVDNADFNFAYRHSNFPEDWIILEVSLKFQSAPTHEVAAQIAQYEEYRRTHQPHGIKTAGSTFKNPEGYRAWELIKNAKVDKLAVGKAHLSEQHCNFLQNDGNSAADIERLCTQIINAVKTQSGIELQLEIFTVGRSK